jgi:hypothetical protein
MRKHFGPTVQARQTGPSGIARYGLRAALVWALFFVSTGSSSLSAAPSEWTPAQNTGIALSLGFLVGAHDASLVASLLLPPPFDVPYEIIGLSTDIGLKSLPPVLEPPADFTAFPTAPASRSGDTRRCVYRFGERNLGVGQKPFEIPDDGFAAGIREETAAVFGITYDRLDDIWSDLGKPLVIHPQADVTVSVSNPYLGPAGYGNLDSSELPLVLKRPELAEGRHRFDWEATTSINYVLDVALPGILLPASAYMESRKYRKLVALKGAKQALKQIRTARLVKELIQLANTVGLSQVDTSNDAAFFQWYQDTSDITAVIRGEQKLVVWDMHLPFFEDTQAPGFAIEDQTIELEATDFGGVRFGRVADALRDRFRAIDLCGKPLETTTDSRDADLLKVGQLNEVTWETREIDGGPYRTDITALRPNQEWVDDGVNDGGENVVTRLVQRISVVDTQAPILLQPAGFARYVTNDLDLTSGSFPLGRPRVVDLADPSPTVSNDAPSVLAAPGQGVDGVRYTINWQAVDDSDNVTPAGAHQQIVTLKRPGSNTPPTASDAAAATLTSQPVEIVLTGTDTDLIDGMVDPLAFEIDAQPDNGFFEAPLYPFFIEDFRLTPVGEREEADNLTRVSPLKHLADAFRLEDPNNHGTFLTDHICEAPAGSLNQATFNNSIPVNFVYEPSYVHVDDDGFFYVRDKFWVCGESFRSNHDYRGKLNPIPRVSKWTEAGELVAMRALYPTDSTDYDNTNLDDNFWPDDGFSVDQNGRLWISWSAIVTALGQDVATYSLDADLADMRYHGTVGYDEQELIAGDRLIAVVGDSQYDLLYELHANGVYARRANEEVDLSADDGILGILDLSQIAECITSGFDFFGNPNTAPLCGTDIRTDSAGNVYVLETSKNRIHKYAPTRRTASGDWQLGEYIGWLGSCVRNKTNPDTGVPYNGCDEDTGTTKGYACTDSTCEQPTETFGDGPGQFNAPQAIVVDPNDILYVADTENLRVQRFAPDGTFAGQAESTGTGINQGDEPGFILGNMGKPKQLAVNSSSFYVMEPDPADGDNFVHVFKTLPFYDITPDSAKVKYVSRFRFQGEDSFTYMVDDGIDTSAPARVDVTVTRAFRKPERLRSQCFSDPALDTEIPCRLAEDGDIYIRLSAYDPDGFVSEGGLDTHSFQIINAPAHGALNLLQTQDNATIYRYLPDADFNGADGLGFEVSDGVETSDEIGEVVLVIEPRPDPVEVELDAEITAGRGFLRTLTTQFSDVDADADRQPSLVSIDWGDGSVASGPDWTNSGRRDPNDREINPQIDVGAGSGYLIASHNYAATGSYPLQIEMAQHPDEGLPNTVVSAVVEVIDATLIAVGLSEPPDAVQPDRVFPVQIAVTNLQPDGWSGLTATNVRVAIEVPDGLTLVPVDARCTPGAIIECSLGALAPDETALLDLTGYIAIADARATAQFAVAIEVTDDGPKIQAENFAVLTIEIADADADGVIDVDDAFPDDPRYSADSDGDGLADGWEEEFGYDPTIADDVSADEDGDGLDLLQEFARRSSPRLADAHSASFSDELAADGDGEDDRFGFRIAGGDLDLDGYADTVIGARLHAGAGAVFISYGSARGAGLGLLEIAAPSGITNFGRAVAVGDWDDNGYPDIAIAGSNAVSIHYNNGQILERPDRILTGADADTDLGTLLVSGDLDGDGIDDLIIRAGPGGQMGAVQLYLSTAGGVDAEAPAIVVATTLGHGAAIGDIDGDGAPDLILGAATPTPSVYGFLASDNDWASGVGGNPSFSLPAVPGQSSFGFSIASGADITGDDIDDLVVGAYGGGGAINVYDSRTAYWIPDQPSLVSSVPPLQTIVGLGAGPGDTHGDQFGVQLALGHLDADRFADLVVGANRAGTADQGQVQVLRGSPTGLAANPQIEDGDSRYDMLGYSVAIPGDIDGDGYNDIAAGAPNIAAWPNPTPDGGYVSIGYHAFVAADPADDPDDDRVGLALDNCPGTANTNQADRDGDGIGDACDDDIDGDGVDNAADICPLDADPRQGDLDADGLGDVCDGAHAICDSDPVLVEAISFGSGAHDILSEHSITIRGPVQLEPGANVSLQAPKLAFGPGFRVAAGATLRVDAVASTCVALARDPMVLETEAVPMTATAAGPTATSAIAPLLLASAEQLPDDALALLALYGVDLDAIAHLLADPDGAWLLFETAQDILPADGNGASDIYRLDTFTETLTLVSRTPDGTPATARAATRRPMPPASWWCSRAPPMTWWKATPTASATSSCTTCRWPRPAASPCWTPAPPRVRRWMRQVLTCSTTSATQTAAGTCCSKVCGTACPPRR